MSASYHLPLPSYLPKPSPLLPTTYQPLPPHSIARAPETLSGSELGAGELGARELGAGARSKGAAGARAAPMRDPGKHIFSLCLFCLFVCGAALQKIRNVAAQLHKRHLLLLLCVARKEEEEKDDVIAFFFFFFFVQRNKLQRRR